MGKFNKYVKELEQIGFETKFIDKNSAVFTRENIKFTGSLKKRNNFEISNVDNPERFEKVISKLNVLTKLKRSDLLPQDVLVQFIDDINNGDIEDSYSNFIKILINAKAELILNLTEDRPITYMSKIKYLLVIIPKSSRAEFIADLQCIIEDMKNDKCSKVYIGFIVMLHIISVAYHAFFFKLKDYFYPNKQQSNKD